MTAKEIAQQVMTDEIYAKLCTYLIPSDIWYLVLMARYRSSRVQDKALKGKEEFRVLRFQVRVRET